MSKSVVAHAIRGYLATTETFVGNQVTTHERYRPVVLCHHRGPNASFNVNDMHVLNEVSDGLGKLSYALFRSMSGYQVSQAAEWIRKYNPALWHFHFAVDASFFLPVFRKFNIPAVVSLYGYDVSSFPNSKGGIGKLYLRRIFDEMDGFLAMSEDMKRDALKLGIPAEKVIVHYHGINTSRFRCEQRSYERKSTFTVLCVGSLDPKKGQHHLLRSLAALRKQRPEIPARVVLVGTGELQSELDAIVREHGLEHSVEFAGFIPHLDDRLPAYYREADVFVHFSSTQPNNDKEGIPGTIVEAMASGLPVVTSTHAGIPEIIQNRVHGLLYDETRPEEITRALAMLYDSQDLRACLGRSAAAHALNHLDVRVKTAALESIYDQFINLRNEQTH